MKKEVAVFILLWVLLVMSTVLGFNDELNYDKDNQDLQVMYTRNPPVHQFISYQSYLMLNGLMKDEFSKYIGGDLECINGGCGNSDFGTTINEGSYEEDSTPMWLNHFWNPNLGKDAGLCLLGDCFDSAYRRALNIWETEVILQYSQNKSLSYYNLGRVVHLLEDISVPAHVYLDAHWGTYGDDSYENYMSKHFNEYVLEDYFSDFTSTTPLLPNISIVNVVQDKTSDQAEDDLQNPDNFDTHNINLEFFQSNGITPIITENISEIFYSMAEIADNYDSDDVEGEVDDGSRRLCDVLGCDIDDENCSQIAEQIMPEVFGHVAGLYRLFWIETQPQIEACSSGVCCDDFWKMTSEDCIKDKDNDGFCEKGYRVINRTLQCPLEKYNARYGTDCNDNDKKVVPPFNQMFVNENTEFCPGDYEIKDWIIINNSNVEIRCNQTTIIGNDSRYTYGFYASSKENLTIRNCRIINFNEGIYFINTDKGLIENNYFKSNYRGGINLIKSKNFKIKNNSAFDNNLGVWLGNTSKTEVSENKFSDNVDGIYLSQDSNENNIRNNKLINGLSGIKIYNSSLNIIQSNFHFDNSYGIYFLQSDKNNATENWINNSYYSGFYACPDSDLNYIWDNDFLKKGIEDWDYGHYNKTDNFYCLNGIINNYYESAGGPECVGGKEENKTFENIFEIFSPLNFQIYNYDYIEINISGNKVYDKIVYEDLDRVGREKVLCRNCNNYFSRKKFADRFYNLSFKAYGENITERIVSFIVDSKIPRILRTYPKKNSFVGGEFGVKYKEENLEEVRIFYKTGQIDNSKVIDCSPENSECWTKLDLGDYNGEIEYYFTVKDITGNVATSDNVRVFADSKKPEIKNIDYSVIQRKVSFDISVEETNFDRVEYKIDNGNWKKFCTRLKNNECYKRTSLSYGEHVVNFAVYDRTGNFDEEILKIEV